MSKILLGNLCWNNAEALNEMSQRQDPGKSSNTTVSLLSSAYSCSRRSLGATNTDGFRQWRPGSWACRRKWYISNGDSGHLYDALVKNLASLTPCPENLRDVKFKDNGLFWQNFQGRMVYSSCCWGAFKFILRINTWSWYINGPMRAWQYLKLASKLDSVIPSSTWYWCSKSKNPKTKGVMESNWG